MGKLISWVARFRNVVKLNERRFLKKKKKKIVGGEIMPARAIIFTIKRHVAMCKI